MKSFARQTGAALALTLVALLSLAAADDLRERAAKAYREHHYDEAVALLRQAVAREPEAFDLWSNLGSALYEQGDYQQAAEMYRRALALSRETEVRARLFYNLGNAQFRAGESDSAIESYKAALRLAPDDQEAKFNLEIALRRRQPPQDNKAGAAASPSHSSQQPFNPQTQAQPDSSSSSGSQSAQGPPRMTREQAERLLDALRQYERVGRQRRPPAERSQSERDW